MGQATGEIKEVLKTLVRESIPELNGFQFPIKAKVVKLHEGAGKVTDFNKCYSVDVQPLKPDGSADEDKPVIPDVPIDITWAGPNRAMMSLPSKDAVVRVEFYYWNPSMPYISGILGDGYAIPAHPVGSLVIQQKNGVFIKIEPSGDVVVETDKEIKLKAGAAKMTLSQTGAIDIGPKKINISAGGDIAIAGGGAAVARVGDRVQCNCGGGTIVSGSGQVKCGG